MQQNNWILRNDGDARWIFPSRPADCVNQIVDFFHEFELDNDQSKPLLRISADTDYFASLNGLYVGKGQYSDYPDQKTYDSYPLDELMRRGNNRLAITVFYNGRTSSVYRRGEPGLIFDVVAYDQAGSARTAAVSGTSTRTRANPCYHSGPIATVSHQLSYTFGYDARKADSFSSADYEPGSEWKSVTQDECSLPEGRDVLAVRPVAKLEEGDLTTNQVYAAGYFRRIAEGNAGLDGRHAEAQTEGEVMSPAWLMQRDYYSARPTREVFGVSKGCDLESLEKGLSPRDKKLASDGIYLIVDMGRQEAGYLEFEVEAPGGAVIDTGYGEHLDDLRVRTEVGGRNFASRYICREGRQRFSHPFLRWAGRYLQLQINTPDFRLYSLGLRRCWYPLEYRGRLGLAQPLRMAISKTARRTLHLCMHEHYEDTPWREQALYANDARIQALCGYYAFGDTVFPASSFTLLGHGLRSDGFLELTAPAKPPITIPSFTLVWILAVRDHYLYSGDDSLARSFLPQIKQMLQRLLGELIDGLLPLRRDKEMWHFYDWSAGMSGYEKDEFDSGLTWDAPLNCFFALALTAASEICSWCNDSGEAAFRDAADSIRGRLSDVFWNERDRLFMTYPTNKAYAQLTQALCVLAGAGGESQRSEVLERIAENDPVLAAPGLSQSFYTYEALMSDKKHYGAIALNHIDDIWGGMLSAGATTFWETIVGASDFDDAGSLCHGWSAVPLYLYYHDLLGIRPLEPGYKTFAIEPILEQADQSSCTVAVPGGEITVLWRKEESGMVCEYRAPSGMVLAVRDERCLYRCVD